jgi:hypothetical protein
MGGRGIRLFAHHGKQREFALGNSSTHKLPKNIRQVPNDGYWISSSVVMNLEAEKMENLPSMLTSHDPRDVVCIDGFNDGIKHGC